ncbi:MAG TPA: hypothetical protein VN805_01075 [Caulobacteraceae bacterium]|nr:hypothetical protein [Caulobacteraceae bacterium]
MRPGLNPTSARSAAAWAAPAIVCVAAVAIAGSAAAATPSREARLFDRPAAIKTLPPKSADDAVGQITCTYYAGLMVRETGTDAPDPGAATVLQVAAAAPRPACGRAASPIAIAMKTDGYSLLGRKGPFLVFEASDPNGAVDFLVISASSGATLFEDGKSDRTGLRAASLVNGVLRLTYTRGLNATCSVVKDGAACWASLAQAGSIPAALGKAPPPVSVCAAAYRKGPRPTPADDPSIILYDVATTVDGAGKTNVTVRGPVTCEPMP